MPLTLKIISKQKHILGSDSVRVFSVHGGTIGRASDNDWMLPDPDRYISAHHAAIDYRGGAYYLRDTSTNGVFVNRSDQPVGAGAPIRLYDGDELRMGDYTFQAFIVDVSGNVGDEPEDGEPRVRLRRKQEDPAELSLKLLGEEAEARNEQMKEGEDPAALEIWSDEQFGSTVRLTNEEIDTKVPVDHGKVAQLRNEDSARYRTDDQLSLDPVPDKPRAAPESLGRRDFTEAVRLLLEHAGLDYSQLPRGEEEEQVLALIGRMVRNTTAGLQSLLRNRAVTKAQFRIAQTGMRPAANNPLKLMSDTQEALEQMFYENSDAYLGPDEAVQEAFRDLRDHQAAILKAMQVSFRHLLDRLEPEELEERFNQAAKPGGLLSGSPKARYWEMYRDAYQSIAGFSDDHFASVLGGKFADAYDREIQAARTRAARAKSS